MIWRSLICLSILVLVSPSFALDIVLTYDERQSQAPTFDESGARLRSLAEAGAAYYEDIIKDDFTVNLAFTWGDLGDDGTLGVATTLDTEGSRPTVSRMRYNTNSSVDWFLDPTPLNHDEYALIQTTVGDFDAATRSSAFTGSPPDLLEVGYAGVRTSGQGTTDLYSVILHEIGHAVGLTSVSIGNSADDGDFDISPSFLNGVAAGIQTSSDDDIAHLAAPRTSLFPLIVEDIRRLPSATDIFAISSAAGWVEIDLPRKEFLDGEVWSSPENWIGNRIPDADDQVTIRHGGRLSITDAAVADNVTIAAETDVTVSASLAANTLSLGAGEHRLVLGSSFEGIQIDGLATVDGSLVIETPTVLEVGQEFTLLTAGELQGSFDSIMPPVVQGSTGFVIDQLPNSLVATSAFVGDINVDGMVNFADFLVLSRNFGERGGWRDGDLNGDESINFEDFLDLARGFGRGTTSPASAVPEPKSLSLLFAAFAIVSLSQRYPRSRFN